MKNLRKILYPFSLPYRAVTGLRNLAFDLGMLTMQDFPVSLIGVGNLTTGGTGKTPMTEYLVRLLKNDYQTAVLSRGYGRKTNGFIEVSENYSVKRVGDEPLQFKKKFRDITVAVDEARAHGTSMLLKNIPDLQIIILDDVFQHRSVRPGLMIMLSAYNSPFYEDLLLPAGNLRESRAGAARADLIVITKCPQDLSILDRKKIFEKIRKYASCPVYFASIGYDQNIFGTKKIGLEALRGKPLTVVTGIAKPEYFVNYLKGKNLDFEHKTFGDHHDFSPSEIKILDKKPLILTTEKDYMRLKPKLLNAQLYYLPIRHIFMENKASFDGAVLNYVKSELKEK